MHVIARVLCFYILYVAAGYADATEASTEEHTPSSPKMQSPNCDKIFSDDRLMLTKIEITLAIGEAAKKRYWEVGSLWEQAYIERHDALRTALIEYEQRRRGQSLREIELTGRTAEEIHKDLLSRDFVYFTKPLAVSGMSEKEFWRLDGTKTTDPRDKNVVLQYIYVHQDGSLIRVKAAGIPDQEGSHPRREPHAIKAVLLKFNPQKFVKDKPYYDTSFRNEAFKVNRYDMPSPKMPQNEAGFTLASIGVHIGTDRLMRHAQDVAMSLVHMTLNHACPVFNALSEAKEPRANEKEKAPLESSARAETSEKAQKKMPAQKGAPEKTAAKSGK